MADITEIFRCSCGGPELITLDRWKWEDGVDDPNHYVFMNLVYDRGPLLYRLTRALKYLFAGELHVAEIMLSKADTERMAEALAKEISPRSN